MRRPICPACRPTLHLDWFYLFTPPAQYATSAGALWALAGVATVLLLALPWLPKRERLPIAQVDLANCNGCSRCFNDCPYAAVIMEPRKDGRPHQMQPVVIDDLCAGCGICAGACPSSTPFRSVVDLVTGIDLPQYPITRLREELEERLAALAGGTKVVVFGCERAAEVRDLAGPDTAALRLVCTGMLPPSFIEYAVRGGAEGVLITGCQTGDCEFRLGNQWMEERIAGEREPHLRANIARERIRVVWAGAGERGMLVQALSKFRASLLAVSADGKRRPLGRTAHG